MKNWTKRALLAAVAAIVMGGLVYALRPLPVPVDAAVVGTGPLEVTVDEEAVTRIREVYRVSAPVAGKVLRSPREVGDAVIANETVVAVILPGDPSFLDARARRELSAAVAAAEAAVALAVAQVQRAVAELVYVHAELSRKQRLLRTNTISEQAYEKARLDVETGKAAVASEKAALELRRRELESAQARLIGPETPQAYENHAEECCIKVQAPVSGRVLTILNESEQRVLPGAPLLEIGDPHDLEIVVELLSSDAVQVAVGADAHVVNWGAPRRLRARVNRIEPAGFMKVSALGIEEQRVNTVLDLLDPEEQWQDLGHDFRVFVRIVVWRTEDTLRVPLSALFRHGEDWAVFRIIDDVARLTLVELGHRNTQFAEVINGVSQKDRVILHPSDRIEDGVRVVERSED